MTINQIDRKILRLEGELRLASLPKEQRMVSRGFPSPEAEKIRIETEINVLKMKREQKLERRDFWLDLLFD